MIIGVPKEIKNNEFRVAITAAGVHEFRTHGHTVLVEREQAWAPVSRMRNTRLPARRSWPKPTTSGHAPTWS